MNLKSWIDFFKKYSDKKVFTLPELLTMTEMREQGLKRNLSSLENRGIVSRVSKGVYVNPFNPPAAEELSGAIKPSYISLEYALHHHNVLSQRPYVVTCVTPLSSYFFKYKNRGIEYVKFDENLFFGFKWDPYLKCNIATPEKALADFFWEKFSKKDRVDPLLVESMVNDMDLDEVNQRKFISTLKNFPEWLTANIMKIGKMRSFIKNPEAEKEQAITQTPATRQRR